MLNRLKVVVDLIFRLAKSSKDRGGALGGGYDKVTYRVVGREWLNAIGEGVLDVDCDDGLVMNWREEDYTTLDGLGGSKSFAFSLPYSARNNALLGGAFVRGGVSAFLSEFGFWAGYGDNRFVEGVLSIDGRSGRGGHWEHLSVALNGEGSLWAKELSELRLSDLPFRGDGSGGMGEVEYSLNMLQTGGVWDSVVSTGSVSDLSGWHDLDRYKEYMALVVNYGYFTGAGGVRAELRDMRLWLFERDLVYLMFGMLGWRIKSRFIDTDFYRRDLVYVLRDLYWSQDVVGANYYGFRAEQTGTVSYTGGIIYFGTLSYQKYLLDFNDDFTLPNVDLSGSFTIGSYGYYTAATAMRAKVSGFFRVSHNNSATILAKIWVIVREASPSNAEVVVFEKDFNGGDHLAIGSVYELSIQTEELNLGVGYEVYLKVALTSFDGPAMGTMSGNIDLLPGSWFSLSVVYKELVLGDKFRLNDIVDPEIRAIDILKGAAHRYGWLFETDVDKRVVTIEPASDYYLPDAGSVYGLGRGFYGDRGSAVVGDGMIDWCEEVSDSLVGKNAGIKRRYRLSYKDGDAYYRYVSERTSGSGNDRRLFDGEWYLGDNYDEGVTVDENPTYAGTANGWFGRLVVPSGSLNSDMMWLPHIWEQLGDGEVITREPSDLSVKISPRVVKFFGGEDRAFYLDYGVTNTWAVSAYPRVGMVDALGSQQSNVGGAGVAGLYGYTLSYGSNWGGYSDMWSGSVYGSVVLGSRDLGMNGYLRLLGLGDVFWGLKIEEWRRGVRRVYVFVPGNVPVGLRIGRFRSFVRIGGEVGRIVRWGGVNIGDLSDKGELEVIFV